MMLMSINDALGKERMSDKTYYIFLRKFVAGFG